MIGAGTSVEGGGRGGEAGRRRERQKDREKERKEERKRREITHAYSRRLAEVKRYLVGELLRSF